MRAREIVPEIYELIRQHAIDVLEALGQELSP
jgi:hypothetical protein